MREEIEELLRLQAEWHQTWTPAMRRRHDRLTDISAWVRGRLPDLSRVMPGVTEDLDVREGDAVGNVARVPWVQVFSRSRSPRAGDGWYVAYVFDAGGDAAYAVVGQGTQRWIDGRATLRPAEEILARARWARSVLAEPLASRADLELSIDLRVGRSGLAASYEQSTVVAFRYQAGAVPDDADLEGDLRFLVRALALVYSADEGPSRHAGDLAPEVADAIVQAVDASSPRIRRRPLLLAHEEREAIERHAVRLAIAHLEAQGFTVRDVGRTESYDLDARRGAEHLFVEVKGTTSAGEEVVLTRNEVALHRDAHPTTMLIMVTGIDLDRGVSPPHASGGILSRIHPWAIAEEDLTPISYRYLVPRDAPVATD